MHRNIGETAALAGVSVRTLRYYDEIGLLEPCLVTEAGYRMYDESALQRLEQILFYRALEFPLSDVRYILDAPDADRKSMLEKQMEQLRLKRDRLNALIRLTEESIKGGKTMSVQKSDRAAIVQAEERYAAEAEARWGKTDAWRQSAQKTSGYDDKAWARIQAEADEILMCAASMRALDPASPAAQEIVERWRKHISRYYYDCSAEILKGLGIMYQADERFSSYLDRYGEGTAGFLAAAIAAS